jgi:alkanesulfonate monooxygenase SsuD/methylene tetrahydromethanopterin reductase-like flavin-dependent oxidoreductase (luciferase family)
MNPTEALVLSQVVLSFGIPFALVPLVLLTCRRDGDGRPGQPPRGHHLRLELRRHDHRNEHLPDLPAALPQLRHPTALDGLAEAIQIIHGAWTHSGYTQHGRHHSVRDLDMKPKPGGPIPVWLRAFGPCALAVTAGLADSWIPSLGSMPTGEIPAVRCRIDAAAEAAGRRPGEIRGILNVSIRIDPDAEPQPRDHRFGQARGKPAMGPPRPRLHRIQLHCQRPRPES